MCIIHSHIIKFHYFILFFFSFSVFIYQFYIFCIILRLLGYDLHIFHSSNSCVWKYIALLWHLCWHSVASACHYPGWDWIGTLWKSSVPPTKLWHGVCVQRLQQEDVHDQFDTHAVIGQCQGLAQVSALHLIGCFVFCFLLHHYYYFFMITFLRFYSGFNLDNSINSEKTISVNFIFIIYIITTSTSNLAVYFSFLPTLQL